MPLEQVVQEAKETFTEPQCPPDRNDCFAIDFINPLQANPTWAANKIIPRAFQDAEKLKHLGEGIRGLLASYRFVEWVQAADAGENSFVSAAVPILLQDSYLEGAKEELASANAGNAIFGQMALLENSLRQCSAREMACMTQQDVLMALNNLVLGYLFVFQDDYNLWIKDHSPSIQPKPLKVEPPLPQQIATTTTTTIILPDKPSVKKVPPPKKNKISHNEAPTVSIQGPKWVHEGSEVRLTAKASDPEGDPLSYQWGPIDNDSFYVLGSTQLPTLRVVVKRPVGIFQHANIQVTVTDTPKATHGGDSKNATATYTTAVIVGRNPVDKLLEEFAEETGGHQRRVPYSSRPKKQVRIKGYDQPNNESQATPILEVIKQALTVEEKKKDYQLMIIIDRSGSMAGDVRAVQKKMGDVFQFAKSQLAEGGEVSIALRWFVDEVYDDNGEVVPLDSQQRLEGKREERLNPEMKELGNSYMEYSFNRLKKKWHQYTDKPEEVVQRESEVSDAKKGLDTILSKMDGTIEYHWEASMNAMDDEPWATGDDSVEKVIIMITDEGDGGGFNIKKYFKPDAVAKAKARGIRFEHILLEEESSHYIDDYSGRGCFSGDTYVQTVDGGILTFYQLMDMADHGQELPVLASYDEASQSVIYQQPTTFVKHQGIHSALLYLNVDESTEQAPLGVTANHPLLIERDEKEIWMKAKELKTGDLLVNPYGATYPIDSVRIEKGAVEVYNLSFSEDKTGMRPTYLVSPDGTHWFVAHNIQS